MNETISKYKKKKPYIIILAALIVLLIGGSIITGLNWNNWFGKPEASQTGNKPGGPDIDPDAGEWTSSKPDDQGGASAGIAIPGYPSISLPKDKKDVEVALLNPEGNPCYFTFEIILKDTGESIYKSKMVPPGQSVNKQTLTKTLAAGTYNATIKITTNSISDQSPMNGADVETVLIVK